MFWSAKTPTTCMPIPLRSFSSPVTYWGSVARTETRTSPLLLKLNSGNCCCGVGGVGGGMGCWPDVVLGGCEGWLGGGCWLGELWGGWLVGELCVEPGPEASCPPPG